MKNLKGLVIIVLFLIALIVTLLYANWRLKRKSIFSPSAITRPQKNPVFPPPQLKPL